MHKNEKQLQAACVIKFRELYPELKNSLWSVRNATFSQRDGMTQRALGMLAGVSDLQFFFRGRFVCLEIKLPGSLHSADHVRRQLSYGKHISEQGGSYYIIRSVDAFMTIINNEGRNDDVLGINEIENLLIESKTKIKF